MSTLVKRELKVKYRGSFLGYLWSMTNPLLFMIIITVVFSFMAKDIPHFSLFVLSGVLFWNLASNSISVATQSMIANAALIRKVYLPLWIFPAVPVLTFATNTILALLPYIVLFFTLGADLPVAWPFIPLILVLYLIFLFGICVSLATINVFFRDVGHAIEPLLVMTMYGSCIFYDRKVMSPNISKLIGLNPFARFIEIWRKAIYGGELITAQEILMLASLSALSLLVGLAIYRRNRHRIIFGL